MLKVYSQGRFAKEECALLLIDHQSGIMQLVHDYSPAEFRSNVLALAKIGRVFELPTIITSSYESGPNGPLMQEILDIHHEATVIRRPGQISAWDNDEFVSAVKATGKKKLIMAGVTTDVCLAFPAMQAAGEGFDVYGVIDASGAHDFATQSMAVQRLITHGVTPVTWLMVAAELQRDWRHDTAEGTAKVFHEHLLNYGMLIDNFNYSSSVSKN